MKINFREKALMALETMPLDQKGKVSKIIEELNYGYPLNLKSYKFNDWDMVKIDETAMLLFKEIDQGFLIIDIIELKNGDCQ